MCFLSRFMFDSTFIDFRPSPATQHLYSFFSFLSCVIYNFIIHNLYFLSEKSAIFVFQFLQISQKISQFSDVLSIKIFHNSFPQARILERNIIFLSIVLSVLVFFNINKLLINFHFSPLSEIFLINFICYPRFLVFLKMFANENAFSLRMNRNYRIGWLFCCLQN